jgi:DNA-binding transcriptional ArsR family regulator
VAAPASADAGVPFTVRVFDSVGELLAEGPRSVNELAAALPVSRPAVSQHLKVLKEAHLVDVRPFGTRRIYGLDPQGVAAVRDYFQRFWDQSLTAFARAVEQTAPRIEEELS